MRPFKKRALGGAATLIAVLGVGGAWANSAGSGEPGGPRGGRPPAVVPLAPGERAREVTTPGEGVPEARWHNCEVVQTMKPTRRFVVDKPDGGTEERVYAQPSVRVHPDGRTTPLGPARHDVDCAPTDAQVREMHVIAGVDPDTGEPIGGLPIEPEP